MKLCGNNEGYHGQFHLGYNNKMTSLVLDKVICFSETNEPIYSCCIQKELDFDEAELLYYYRDDDGR